MTCISHLEGSSKK